MEDYYIHQIGNMYDEKTYQTLVSILKNKTIASRDYLSRELGILIKDDERPFDGKIPRNEFYYITDDEHKDRVSLSDPNDKLVKKSIERKSHSTWTCFDYNNIAFRISKNIEPLLIPTEETKYLVPGEVQVRDKIDSDYIVGLILPITEEQLQDEKNIQIIDAIAKICEKNDFPLDIYNYEGELIREKNINMLKK